MKTRLLLLAFLCATSTAMAQTTLGEFLHLVEENSPTLLALRKKMDAEKALSSTGLTPDDPAIAYKYMAGNADNGTLHSLAISQTFEFPTVYSNKREAAQREQETREAEYQRHRRVVVAEAQQVYIEAVYLAKQGALLQQRVHNADGLYQAWQQKLSAGDATAIELNKIALERSLAQNHSSQNKLAYQQALGRLQWFAGTVVTVADTYTLLHSIARDSLLALWQQHDAEKLIAERRVSWSDANVQVAKAQSLPTFSIGYEGETAAGVTYQGPTVGISIPLWRNNNAVAAAEAEALYAKAQLAERQYTLTMEFAAQWERTEQTRTLLESLREQLRLSDNSALLEKSLQAGMLSIVEYFNQRAIVYDIQEEILHLEKLYYQQQAELYQILL